MIGWAQIAGPVMLGRATEGERSDEGEGAGPKIPFRALVARAAEDGADPVADGGPDMRAGDGPRRDAEPGAAFLPRIEHGPDVAPLPPPVLALPIPTEETPDVEGGLDPAKPITARPVVEPARVFETQAEFSTPTGDGPSREARPAFSSGPVLLADAPLLRAETALPEPATSRPTLRPVQLSALPIEAGPTPRRLDFVLEPARLGTVRVSLVLAGGQPRLTVTASTEAGYAALRSDGDLLLPILREIRGGEGQVQIVLQGAQADNPQAQGGPATSTQGETMQHGRSQGDEARAGRERQDRSGEGRPGDEPSRDARREDRDPGLPFSRWDGQARI